MKFSKLLLLIGIIFSVQFGASASQVISPVDNSTTAVSFGFLTDTPTIDLAAGDSFNPLFTGIENYKSKSSGNGFAKAAKAMRWVWIGGLIGTIVTGAMFVTGITLYAIGWFYYWNPTNPNIYRADYYWIYWIGYGFLGSGAGLLFGLFLPALIAGLILESIFKKKAAGALKLEISKPETIGLVYSFKF